MHRDENLQTGEELSDIFLAREIQICEYGMELLLVWCYLL